MAIRSLRGLSVVLDLLLFVSSKELVVEQFPHVVQRDLYIAAFGWIERFVSDRVLEEVCQAFETEEVAVARCFEALVSGEPGVTTRTGQKCCVGFVMEVRESQGEFVVTVELPQPLVRKLVVSDVGFNDTQLLELELKREAKCLIVPCNLSDILALQANDEAG